MTVEQKSPITRRAITRGIAWSVPAFAIATAAPALAQSPLVTFTPSGAVCKYSGGSVKPVKHAYFFPVTITNTSHEDVKITALEAWVIVDGSTLGGTPQFWQGYPGHGGSPDADGVLESGPGQSSTWNFVVDQTGNSAMTAGTVYLKVLVEGKESGRAYEYTVELSFPGTPPCDGSEVEEPEEQKTAVAPASEEDTGEAAASDSEPAEPASAEEPAAEETANEGPAADVTTETSDSAEPGTSSEESDGS